MLHSSNPSMRGLVTRVLACTLLASPALYAQSPIERPRIAEVSSDHGLMQPSQEVTLTVHLNARNQAAFDKAVEKLYRPGSPTYHQWMTNSEIARYAPGPADVETVQKELESHGLSILSVSPDHFSIRARGAATSVESAFQTQIHEFEREGKIFHANATPAQMRGSAGSLVRGVTGLTDMRFKPYLKYQVDPRTGKPRSASVNASINRSAATATTNAVVGFDNIATNICFTDPDSITSTTFGDLPDAIYIGNTYGFYWNYGKDCSWTPAQVQAYYGLTGAYAQGIDGTGQTVVLIDGPADGALLTSDMTLFSSLAGLPATNSSNFSVIYPDGKPSAMALKSENWQDEASLESQWVHAIAPKAKVVVLIMPTDDWSELEYGIDYAVQNKLGNVISNSYGFPEGLSAPHMVSGFEQLLEQAAAAGIAVNFGTGNDGDGGTGVPNGGTEPYPASSIYATAVGGTSIGVPTGKFQHPTADVGWGNNVSIIAFTFTDTADPPAREGFDGGSGGGESILFAKPSWQESVAGNGRQEPDISVMADPRTGAVIVENGSPRAGVGGTSLSTPIFSAIWALADQKAGKSLGQAAPLLYSLPSTAITDVVPVSSPTNVAGVVFDSRGATFFPSDILMAPLYSTTQYYSATWTLLNQVDAISFGTDTSLTITPGWDNVTGLGVPNGLNFINAVAEAK